MTATEHSLRDLTRPLRSRTRLAWTAIGVGAAALVLGIVAWLFRLGWVTVPYWVLAAWAVAGVILVAVVWLAWDHNRRLTAPRVARNLEDLGAWRRGALTSLLDSPAPNTSRALLQLADRAQAAELQARGTVALEPLARAARLLLLGGAACLLLGILAFTSAGPVRGAASALWHPHRAWEATVAPVRLRAARETVDRGQPVE
ncbi:MAG TPA: hypothetical protein VD930_13900, partial [Gemmatimonadales bacterium]|nr:hypothetical protein [Gemmatimonadales bacterium]